MTQFESRIPEIVAMGAQLAFIAAEKRHGVWKPETFLQNHPIASVFLLDEHRIVTKAYGLRNPFSKDAINIAHPATLIINRNAEAPNTEPEAILRYIYRGDNQSDRANIDEVLNALRETNELTS